MRAIRIMANLHVTDVDAARSFYTGYLGLSMRVQHGMGGPLYLSRHRGGTSSSSHATRPHPRIPSSLSTRAMSTVRIKKLDGSATRSCDRSRQNHGVCAGPSSAHRLETSSMSCAIGIDQRLDVLPSGNPQPDDVLQTVPLSDAARAFRRWPNSPADGTFVFRPFARRGSVGFVPAVLGVLV